MPKVGDRKGKGVTHGSVPGVESDRSHVLLDNVVCSGGIFVQPFMVGKLFLVSRYRINNCHGKFDKSSKYCKVKSI